MGIRRIYRDLSTTERNQLVSALHALKVSGFIDRFADIHARHFSHGIHRSSHFLPWHREMILRFERELQAQSPGLTLPYWSSTVDTSPKRSLATTSFGQSSKVSFTTRRIAGWPAEWPLRIPLAIRCSICIIVTS